MKKKPDAPPDPLIAASQQWNRAGELIKRVALEDEAVRGVLACFVDAPVEDGLAGELVSEVSNVSERVAALLNRSPDLKSALNNTLKVEYSSSLDDQRNCFARDAKLLSLVAELSGYSLGPAQVGQETVLPSGIKVYLDSTCEADDFKLLNPSFWESRLQKKDRVYRVEVGGKTYILKEKKTERHKDTMNHHREPLNAAQEFAVARDFCERGRLRQEDVFVEWEKPIGYVIFPDGYQFTLFEANKEIAESKGIFETSQEDLTQLILSHPEQFQEEYEEIAAFLEKGLDSRTQRYGISPGRKVLDFLKQIFVPGSRKLRFKEYALAKAASMVLRAQILHANTPRLLGYTNLDQKLSGGDRAIFVRSEPYVELGVVGFDFEYFVPLHRESRLDESPISEKMNDLLDPVLVHLDEKFSTHAPMWLYDTNSFCAAAYLALLQRARMPIQSNRT